MNEKLTILCTRYSETIIFLLIGVFVFLFFLTSPTAGDFSYSDAPRHALNGVFVKDIITEMPFSDLKQYAISYYLKYPALTILFYPPLMSFLMAGFYAVFGISHTTAQLSISIFYFALAIGYYLLARRYLPNWQAFSASLLLISAPEISFWGRQVMLDIPACAWLIFSILFLMRYLDNKSKKISLFICAFFLICALYTKQTIIFVIPVFAFVITTTHGFQILRKQHIWWVFFLFLLCLIPLIIMTIEFGQVNIASAAGARGSDIPRDSLWAWIYYLRQIPHQFGWLTTIFSLIFIAISIIDHHWRLPKNAQILFLSWLIFGYLFFSAISLRDPRLNLPALLPLAILAILTLNRILTRFGQPYATSAALLLALSNVIFALFFQSIPYVRGYAEAARVVLDKSPDNSMILFSGQRDGSFIFNIRTFATEKNVSVLRADKILLNLSIERSRGYRDLGLSEDAIHDLINRHAVHYIVAQTDFWTDIPSMASLQNLLHNSSRFEVVQVISMKANYNIEDREIIIYRNLGKVSISPEPLSLQMIGIGRTFSNRENSSDHP